MTHGTYTGYCYGCRCQKCRDANAAEAREHRSRRAQFGPLIVDAAEAREHIDRLMRAHLSASGIAKAAGLGAQTVSDIRRGKRDAIRLTTSEAILAVPLRAVPSDTYVSRRPGITLMRKMQRHGITLREQGLMLGYQGSKSPRLAHYRGPTMRARNHKRIVTLYTLLARQGRVPASALEDVA